MDAQLSTSLDDTMKSHRARLTDKHTSVSSNILSSPKPPLELCLLEDIGKGTNGQEGWSWVRVVETAASVTKVECCALMCPCLCISTRVKGQRLEVVRAEPNSK